MLFALKSEISSIPIFALIATAPWYFVLKKFFSIIDFVGEKTPSETIK